MRQTRTRILSLLLALVMCLSLLPVTALAAGGSSGEPALFLDPTQKGEFSSHSTVIYEPFFLMEGVMAGKPAPATYTVQVFDQTSGKVLETGDRQEGTQTIDFRNRGNIGYEFVSITPSTDCSYKEDTKILTYQLNADTVIAVRSSYLNIDFTITYDLNGAGSTRTEKVRNGSPSIPRPEAPSIPGYRFLGWYEGTPGTDGYLHKYGSANFNRTVTEDRTFYAMWEREASSGFTITFDPNGGNVSPTSKQTGPDGRVSGGYPTPTREGYTFLGWFTDGDGYKPSDNEVWSGNQKLVARWEKAPQAARITLYPNGGRFTKIKDKAIPKEIPSAGFYLDKEETTGVDPNGYGRMLTRNDGFVDEKGLPIPEREGYTFDGWYIVSGPQANQAGDGKLTDFTGLSQLGTAPFFPQGVELAAKWTATDVCTVTFNYNNRTGKTEQIKIAKGDTIKLPQDPVWAKHTFQGWISGDIVGNEIINAVLWTEESKVTKDITLFATWAEGEADETLKGLTYRFGNNRPAFRYSESYEIPQIRYEMVLGKTQGEWIYKYYGRGWGGNCYGMAATSGMFFHGNGSTTTASFRSGAEVPYDLSVTDRNGSLNMSLTEYIEAVFVSQYARVIQSDYGQQADLNSLASSVKTVRSTRAPVMIAIRGEAITERGEHVNSGHAVLGYDIIDVNSTESRLMIYDPNFPNTERYITLKKSGNNYVSWAYKLNDMYDWGTGRTYNSISVVPYSDYSQAWNNRAVHSNDPALFSTNAINACTRGQIVTFLWRAAGSPKPTSSNNPFIDVKAGAYYYDAVLWAVEKGITSGTSATTFSPNTVCTRGQTVTFLWRAAGSPKAASSTNPFSDVQSGAYYYDAVLWAVEQKVTSGTSATTFAPGSTVTRGQTVTFLYRSQGK